jgi:hypothetical protein
MGSAQKGRRWENGMGRWPDRAKEAEEVRIGDLEELKV